jgi:hypothetical protein
LLNICFISQNIRHPGESRDPGERGDCQARRDCDEFLDTARFFWVPAFAGMTEKYGMGTTNATRSAKNQLWEKQQK